MPIVELCTHRECGRYCTEGRHCAEHAKVWRMKDSARRNTIRARIYSETTLAQGARSRLARDDYTCRHCGHYDPRGRGLVCDHIHGALTRGVDPFNAALCQALCRRCSGVKDGARTRSGWKVTPGTLTWARLERSSQDRCCASTGRFGDPTPLLPLHQPRRPQSGHGHTRRSS
jgi:hypothetical protein